MNNFSLLSISTAMLCGLYASSASAHIRLMGDLQARGGDEKSIPCDGPKGSNVYTFEPGATVTLTLEEYIPHDSYFRIAFDNDSSTAMDLKDPVSIDPINPNRVAAGGIGSPRAGSPKCLADMKDNCGQSDFCNMKSPTGPMVLYDNIEPHLDAASKGSYTWTIKLPNIECESCVIQVIQVMEDIQFGFHGPYDGANDVYHRCVDVKLVKGAGTSGPGNATGPVNVGASTMACTGDATSGAAGEAASGGAGGSVGPADAAAGDTGAAAGGSGAAAGSTASGSAATATGGMTAAAGTTGTTTSGVSSGAAGRAAAGGASASSTGASGGSLASAPPTTVLPTTQASAPAESGGCSISGRSETSALGSLAFVFAGFVLARRRSKRSS